MRESFPSGSLPCRRWFCPSLTSTTSMHARLPERLREAGLRVDVDLRNEKVNYKIRDWETKKAPYMLVVGDKEQQADTVAVRKHRKGDTGSVALKDIRDRLLTEVQEKIITS